MKKKTEWWVDADTYVGRTREFEGLNIDVKIIKWDEWR